MKKLLLTLMGLVLCVAANAADYYLVGAFNNWTTNASNCKFDAKGDGSYELDYNGTISGKIKICDGSWDHDDGIWGSNGSNLVAGNVYTMTTGKSSSDIVLANPIVNPHLVFNPTANTLLVTGEIGTSKISYCIHGQIVTGNWEDIALTESNGKWVLAKQQLKAGEFGLRKLENGTPAGWISADGTATVVIGTPMKAKYDGSNFKLATAGEYTFTFDPTAMTVTIAGDGETPTPTPDTTTVTIVGDYNLAYSGDKENVYYWPNGSPSWPGTKMSTAKGSDGKTYKVFKLPEGTTGLVFNTNGDSNKTDDITYKAGFVHDDNGATPTAVVFTQGEEPTPTPDTYPANVYLIGDVNGESWNIAEPVDMTANNGVYTANGVVFANPETAVCTFSFITRKATANVGSNWDDEVNQSDRYGAAEDKTPYTVGESATVTLFAAGVNASAAGSWSVAEGTYNVTLDLTNNTMTLVNAGETPDPEVDYSEWYVNIFGPFNDWEDNGINPVNGLTKHEDLAIGTKEFKVKIWDGKKDIYYSTGGVVPQNEWLVIDGDAPDQNMTVAGASEGQKFNVEWDCARHAIKVTSNQTGISEIEAANDTEAVYYNLQGVRVANPTNGLFIRVANGKTSKVLVK